VRGLDFKPIAQVIPSWTRGYTVVSHNTKPPRWVPCSGCGGTGLWPGRVGGYDMMCSCSLCMGGGGRFEIT